jgi:RNA polymerase sigma-70 factor (ECF subfamily)
MTGMDRDLELALIAGLQRADGEAFDRVYAAFHARLFNFLARLSRRRDVAEDLVEETWLRVVTHAPRLRDDTRLAPWLFAIARNLYVSYCRSRALDYDVLAGVHLWSAPPLAASPFEVAAAGELQQRVEAALATMPGTYREALLLVALEGLTPAEAADVCGVKPETMRQRLKRARALLARRLDASAAASVAVLKEVWP